MIGIVLKEGIKVEVSKKNGEMGSPRITVCRPRGHQKKLINLQEALELHFEPPCATVIPQLQKITVRAKHLGITYRSNPRFPIRMLRPYPDQCLGHARMVIKA